MNSRKGDVQGFRKVLRFWPVGVTFNRLKLPAQFQDKWVMNDLVKQRFLIYLGNGIYQKTERKNSFHKRKLPRRKLAGTAFVGTAGRALMKQNITDPERTIKILEMRAGENGEAPASYQAIAGQFNISRQRVEQILKKNGVGGRVLGKDSNFLTTTQAATYLTVSYRSVRDWAVTGTLPFYQKRVGRTSRFLFRKEDLDTFKQEKVLTRRRTLKENQGLKPVVERLLQLGVHPQEIAKLSGVGITTVYHWMYGMPGQDKRIGVAMEKILSDDKVTLADAPNLATGE